MSLPDLRRRSTRRCSPTRRRATCCARWRSSRAWSRSAAELREPHRVARYLEDTTAIFNRWYDTGSAGCCRRATSRSPPINEARLVLVAAARTVLANGLGLLGVSAPERM